MVYFFKKGTSNVYAVQSDHELGDDELRRLSWLFDDAKAVERLPLRGRYVGPRREMITPWSTNAVEITENMGLHGIERIERYTFADNPEPQFDPMLQRVYDGLNTDVFDNDAKPAPVEHIQDLDEYNVREGLALSPEEIAYLRELEGRLGRPLTDSEVFGFSQVNSEHCRHKIFNGTFIIDGVEKSQSLFQLIKKTSKENPNGLVSAYKDNVAFVKGPVVEQFYPATPDRAGRFEVRPMETVLSLKAETHNFPTTVEPFNGAATGTGGEIRDRLGGGRASLPLAGTAVYMTSYPRLGPQQRWELMMNPRAWLYQTPAQILIKASNGASDFGNKFGQPLICGSLLTFEHKENDLQYAYDKVIMLAGGVGYAMSRDAIKCVPEPGQAVVVMGGDNYRIGMGGGAVSSVATGQYTQGIELNAVQRANPEMQKRVSNVIRALAENPDNPIVSIHDHGAGGHLNALSELVEETGGHIDLDRLPVGDKTLSAREIVGNESQERMGMVLRNEDVDYVERIARRERAPMYVVGQTTGDHRFVFERDDHSKPIDLAMSDMFGSSPRTTMADNTLVRHYANPKYYPSEVGAYIRDVLTLEAVACKDWLTNKVDRSITGKVARQQCQGEIQLPVSDCGVVALDYTGRAGIATSLGHAPQAALADSARGSVLAIAEALTNIVCVPLKNGLSSVSLSANWMWPCKNPGEDAALYRAVQACSDFACALGINIPTGKDSLSMTQKYGDTKVMAPGTVIISAAAETQDVRKAVPQVLQTVGESRLYYIDFSSDDLKLGGSALFQSLGAVGSEVPTVTDPEQFAATFQAVQQLILDGDILAMHDVSAGGLITTLLEMAFPNVDGGITIRADGFKGQDDLVKILFAENPAVVIQVRPGSVRRVEKTLYGMHARFLSLGEPTRERSFTIRYRSRSITLDIDELRDQWYHTSYLMDRLQSGEQHAQARYDNYKRQPLRFKFPRRFDGTLASRGIELSHPADDGKQRVRAAIIREKGVNGDREMAYSLYLAGFDVKDVHMTDLMSGAETLDDVNMIAFCGGFSHSDVLGSAKGWASGFRYNENAKSALERFYAREDTMSLGVCNGCQLMVELNLLNNPANDKPVTMEHNESGKFESAFLGVQVCSSPSIMLSTLTDSHLGIWVAHGEGRFSLPMAMGRYNIAARYAYPGYPGNPNGSRGRIAALTSDDGRHLAIMPHLERAILPWQWANYPHTHRNDEVTPWIDAFINARKWIEAKLNS